MFNCIRDTGFWLYVMYLVWPLSWVRAPLRLQERQAVRGLAQWLLGQQLLRNLQQLACPWSLQGSCLALLCHALRLLEELLQGSLRLQTP